MRALKVTLFAQDSGFKQKILRFVINNKIILFISDDCELNCLKILISNAGTLDRYWK